MLTAPARPTPEAVRTRLGLDRAELARAERARKREERAAAEAERARIRAAIDEAEDVIREIRSRRACKIIRAIEHGYWRDEIAEMLGCSEAEVAGIQACVGIGRGKWKRRPKEDNTCR